ncbi:MAG: type II toxin-antitoxin system VapC family toxin [Desulfamplus sp.]|nr:type II toxin-antitoxin system VapC family toxin [Desulfamplus sp.]
MKKLLLYLETSVWNFYFADDAPEKQAVTFEFFNQIKRDRYRIFVSEIVFREIDKADDEKKSLLLNLIAEYNPEKLEITEEALTLAEEYIREGILPAKSVDDSIHASIATVYGLDALISWNLKHLANLSRMRKINGVNLKNGYSNKLDLVTPMEVCNEI